MARRHKFVVRIPAYTPIWDMLCFDQCWPASGMESGKLEALARGEIKHDEVTFETDYALAPTIKRWESFTCKVTLERA